MNKILMAVFCSVCVFGLSAVSFAQEEPKAEEPAVEAVQPEVVVAEDSQVEEAQPTEQSGADSLEVAALSGRELLARGLSVQPGATAMVNVNEVEVTTPDEINVRGQLDVNVLNGQRSWCSRKPGLCVISIAGGFAVATVFGFIIADQCGAFDHTNSVMYR